MFVLSTQRKKVDTLNGFRRVVCTRLYSQQEKDSTWRYQRNATTIVCHVNSKFMFLNSLCAWKVFVLITQRQSVYHFGYVLRVFLGVSCHVRWAIYTYITGRLSTEASQEQYAVNVA